jgi:general secretion pathway protein D
VFRVRGWRFHDISEACIIVALSCVLEGCAGSNSNVTASAASSDAMDSVRKADLSARFLTEPDARSGGGSGESSRPFLFPGLDVTPEPRRDQDPSMRTASLQQAAFVSGDGVEINFDGADVQTVAKSLLGDILQLNFVVDPRVQGNITLASAGPIPRKDVLPAFESVLRMSNAAIVRSGNLTKIVPIPEASTNGAVIGAGESGFGVSLVPLRYTSAATVAKTAESFLSRPGSIRVVPSRNLLLVQGTTAEREATLDVISTFDVEWLKNQSVGVYPLKSTSPETMIAELERIFETSDGGMGQGVIRFQPISRMNAVMVVTKTPNLLAQTTQWVRRLDRSDTTGTTLRTFRLKNGNATQVANILTDIFVQRGGGDSAAKQIAPGINSSQSRLDSLDRSPGGGGVTTASASGGTDNQGSNPIAAAFGAFSDRKGTDTDTPAPTGASLVSGGNAARGVLQNVRISADTANNSIVVYSNQEDYRVVERALRDLDKPRLQVAIDATVAEVTLTNELQYGVQFFLNSKTAGLGTDKGSIGLLGAAQTAAQSALLQRVAPGLNLLLGQEGQPGAILNALSNLTEVKVLSSPSLVALDNQPALLQVGDEIPITTSSAAVLANSAAPIINTIQMRNTGVILKVLPHINVNGAIQLEVDQEISSVANPGQQTLTPTISQRRVHSTVAVTSGQTVLLAGLISEHTQQTRSGIPGLSEIKFFGDIFGNTDNTRTRSEIIVFIKTQLIRNSVEAGAVTQEFRERLQSMRSGQSVINGTGFGPRS